MSNATYFISDLHLAPERPRVTAALGEFLDQHRDAEALYILGDLFEFWVGDDDDAPIVGEVAHMLQHFSQDGPALYLMHGNRDFLIGERFATRVGATLLDDPTVIELHGNRVLLMHGDSLCTRDTDYLAFRALARSKEWQDEALARPLEERRALAQHLREVSRDAGSRKAEDIMDVTGAEVLAQMEAHDTRTLIHGHTHRPARHEISSGERWVLGDWEASGWYLRASSGEFELVEFPIN